MVYVWNQNMKPNSKIISAVLRTLSRRYTERGMTHLDTPEDTLVATMLSAQTTDVQVLKAFPGLRKKFPNWKALACARVEDIEKTINTINLYKTKAKALKGMAQRILLTYKGKVPHTMDELITLPGVGRKTASIMLSACFNEPSIAVDTHVLRIMTKRLAWSHRKTPTHIETDLKALVPKAQWSTINRVIVPFGRDICKARRPECWRCPIAAHCPFMPKTSAPVLS